MRKNSFTLVELLIVIIIIGILATMAVPQYNKMVTKSKDVQAYIKMDGLRKAELIYYAEKNAYYDISWLTSGQVIDVEGYTIDMDKYFTYAFANGYGDIVGAGLTAEDYYVGAKNTDNSRRLYIKADSGKRYIAEGSGYAKEY